MSEAFKPKIVAFLCNWCSYTASDLAGTARIKYSPHVRILRVMCSGRVDPAFVLKAFALGADGVMIAGCHPGDCHYIEQNYKTIRRHSMLRYFLEQMGIEPERLRLIWASAAEGQYLAESIDSFVADVRKLGALNWSANWQEESRHEEMLEEIVREHAAVMEVQPWSGEDKGKLALYWAASCGGCDISVLAINEKILDVAALFDIVFWPVALDAKVHDVEKMPDGSIDVCLFNGGIRTSEQEYMAQLLRRKSKVLVAFGSCAQEGCIPGLANLSTRRQVFDTVYRQTPSTENPSGLEPQPKTEVPEGTLHLPVFYDTLRTLDQTVKVDYYLPGCPPEAERIWEAITAIVERRLPPPGSVIGATTTVCQECKRTKNEKKIKKFYRTWQILPDEETCLLEQGLLCCGIATRAGCGALCPQVNSPCIGCHGPNEGADDYGARMMAALSSMIDSNDPEEIDRIIREGIPDPVGSFYRFSLASSQLRRANMKVPSPSGRGLG